MRDRKVSAASFYKLRPSQPCLILSAAEIVERVEALSLDELIELHNHTCSSTGDDAYRVQASEWFSIHTLGLRK